MVAAGGGRPAAGRELGTVAVLLAAMALAFFGPLFWQRQSLAFRDVAVFHMPYKWAVRAAWQAGELPLWNAGVHAGQPIVSNPNYTAVYPPALLWIALPFLVGMKLFVVAHFLWGGLGAWMLARTLGAGPPGRSLAAVVYAAGGVSLSLVNTLNFFAGASWVPWACAAALLFARGGGLTALAAAAGCLAMQLLAGEPVCAVAGALAIGVLVLADAAGSRRGMAGAARRGGGLAVLALAAALLAAPQLLPAWSHMRGARRWQRLDERVALAWSLHPARLAELAGARIFGDPAMLDERGYWGGRFATAGMPYVLSLYPGALATVALLAAIASAGRGLRGPLVLVACGLLLAFGSHTPLAPLLRQLPLLRALRYPEKLVLVAHLGWALAAALVLDRAVSRRLPRRALVPGALLVALVAAAAGAAALHPQPVAAWIAAGWGGTGGGAAAGAAAARLAGELGSSALALGAALGILALLGSGGLQGRLALVAPLLFAALELAARQRDLNPAVADEFYARPPPLALALRGQRVLHLPQRALAGPHRGTLAALGNDRAALHRETVRPYSGILWGVEYGLNGDFDETLTAAARRQEALAAAVAGRGERREWERLLALHAIGCELRYALPDEVGHGAAVVTRAGTPPSPRYRGVHRVVRADTTAELGALAAASGYDFTTTAFVQRFAGGGGPAEVVEDVDVSANVETPATRSFRVSASGPAFLAIAQTWDPAWRVRVDGRPAALVEANFGLSGIALAAGGERRVELRALPPAGLAVGMLCAALTLSLCGAHMAGGFGRRRRRRS